MAKQTRIWSLLLVLAFLLFPRHSFAIRLLTEEQALKQMFPEADKITAETKADRVNETDEE